MSLNLGVIVEVAKIDQQWLSEHAAGAFKVKRQEGPNWSRAYALVLRSNCGTPIKGASGPDLN
jgi:hypothetical protein